jgi:hypothetical protein
MHYDFIAIPDADVPQAVEPTFQHVLRQLGEHVRGYWVLDLLLGKQ